MEFINLERLNIQKRNSCASALALSDVQPLSVYKSHILNGPMNKLYLFNPGDAEPRNVTPDDGKPICSTDDVKS